MEKFVVLAGRRSGTTLLVESLDSHPDVECRKDVFSIRRRWKRFQVDVMTGLFYQYRSASLKRQFDYLFRRRRLVRAFLDETLAPAKGVLARGIRLSYEQVRKYPDILPWVLENDVRIIHLVRESSLKAVVSHFTAKKRGFAHATSQVERVTLRLPPAELRAHLEDREREIERYRALFQGRPCCEVSYESFLARREEESRRLLAFLGIERYAPLTSRLVKQNPDSLRDILENYDEIAQALRGTPFERHLET
jgi:sulfotransferase family protein